MVLNRNLGGVILTMAFIVCSQYEPITAASSTSPSPPQNSDTPSSPSPLDGSTTPPPRPQGNSSGSPPPPKDSSSTPSRPPGDLSGSSPPPPKLPGNSSGSPPPQPGPMESSASPPPGGPSGAPQSAPQTDDKIDTGCTELDKCLTTFSDNFGTSFVYNENTCSHISTALDCFHTKRDTCGDSYDLYSSVDYDFQKLETEFKAYCPASDFTTSCTKFNDCFAKIKLPGKKNYLIDPVYWCAVISATQSCGDSVKEESGCDSLVPNNASLTKVNGYCPDAFDVTTGNYESNSRILAASTLLTISAVMLHFLKSWM